MSMSITPPDNFYIANSNKTLSQRQGLNVSKEVGETFQSIIAQNASRTQREATGIFNYLARGEEWLVNLRASQDSYTAQLVDGFDQDDHTKRGLYTLSILDSDETNVKEYTLDANQPAGVFDSLDDLWAFLQAKT
jgi:hypothetical protein